MIRMTNHHSSLRDHSLWWRRNRTRRMIFDHLKPLPLLLFTISNPNTICENVSSGLKLKVTFIPASPVAPKDTASTDESESSIEREWDTSHTISHARPPISDIWTLSVKYKFQELRAQLNIYSNLIRNVNEYLMVPDRYIRECTHTTLYLWREDMRRSSKGDHDSGTERMRLYLIQFTLVQDIFILFQNIPVANIGNRR